MDHRQLANNPTDAGQHQLHKIGFTVADVTALGAISTSLEYDVALVQSPPSLYMYVTIDLLAQWVPLASFSTPTPDVINDITTDGIPIQPGTTVFDVGADSFHPIPLTSLAVGNRMRLYQKDGFTATLTLPDDSWNFSDGNKTLLLGYKANCSLNYYGGNVVVIEYNTPGVTS